MVQDLTRGKPVKLILLFTIPLLIGNVFQQFYSMADTIIVGRTIGVDALAGVGATGSLSFLILGFAQGLTAGLSVITAQRFGADDYDGVRKSVTVSLLISAVLTVVLTAIAVLTARPLLTLLQTPATSSTTRTTTSSLFSGAFSPRCSLTSCPTWCGPWAIPERRFFFSLWPAY